MTNTRSLESLTAEDFVDVVGSRFELPEPRGHATLQLELAEVTPVDQVPSAGFRKPFSVLFQGPIEPVLPQGTYRLDHDRLGPLDLFIVPVGPEGLFEPGAQPTTMRYEAVFG